MISISDAFGWLNNDEPSHLSAANQLTVIQIHDAVIPQEHREAIARSLRASAVSIPDTLERLEVLANLGRAQFEKGNYGAAGEIFSEVAEGYATASHRQAVAKWLLGMALWRTMDNDAAYANWFKAREFFTAIAQIKVKNHVPDKVSWYNDVLDRMRLDMAATAEEAYYWLNQWEPSHLSASAKLLADELKKQIRRKQYPLAFEIGTKLSRTSRNRLDTSETAEAWVMLGLAVHQMGVPRLAIEYWQRGASSFTPWSHQQAVTRWMIGIAQWQIPSENDQATRSWRDAIETFVNLQTQADHANDQGRREWYQTQAVIMERALAQSMRERLPR